MRTRLFVLVGLAALFGCGGGEPVAANAAAASPPAPPAAPPTAPAVPAVAPTPPAPATPPTDRVDDAAFELRLTPADAYAAGKLGSFALTLKPRGEWHLNQDFPTEVSVSGAAGLAFPTAKLGKAAAAEFGDEIARFDVPFTAQAPGEHTVECHVKFAVCSEENCIPEERTLALALRVN